MTQRTELAAYIATRIDASGRTQREIARDAGLPNSNFVSMIRTGQAKIPLNRVPALADALGMSRTELLFRCLDAYHPEMYATLKAILPGLPETEDEIALMRGYRMLKEKGVLDGEGVELRALPKPGRKRSWARLDKE